MAVRAIKWTHEQRYHARVTRCRGTAFSLSPRNPRWMLHTMPFCALYNVPAPPPLSSPNSRQSSTNGTHPPPTSLPHSMPSPPFFTFPIPLKPLIAVLF